MNYENEIFLLNKYKGKTFKKVYDKKDLTYIKYLLREKDKLTPIQQDNVHKFLTYVDAKNAIPSPKSIDIFETKIIETKTNIRYIYHLADIHIRITKRHTEYQEVFDRLYKYISSVPRENSIIVLCGDILHNKTNLGSNQIEIATNFFKNLSNIMPLIIIAGNHDANLTNPDIIDSLTPIVKNINNIHYLKKTGMYQYGNITFSVMSVFDNKFIPSTLSKTQYKIALFHAPVYGCRDIEGKLFPRAVCKRELKEFENYDLVLLGDIHVHQYLNEHTAYPGSLIQQNHGEPLENHGLIKWTLSPLKSEYINIYNDYGFCTLKIENGKLNAANIPKKPYLRLEITNTTTDQLNTILSNLKQNHDIQEITRKPKAKIIDQQIIVNKLDHENQNKLIDKFFENKQPPEMIERIKEINDHLNKTIDYDNIDKINDQKWELIKLEFTNLLSYGKSHKNIIDFEKKRGIIGIPGQNRIGKSSIFDIIIYGLFDVCPRCNYSELINNKEDSFTLNLQFRIGKINYFIEKKGSYKRGKLIINVDFYKIVDNKKISLNDEHKQITYSNEIKKLVGRYEDFLVTCMSMQKNNTGIIDMSPNERKKVLKELLQLDKYDKLYEAAKEEHLMISRKMKEFKEKLNYEMKKDHQSYLLQEQNELKEIDDNILNIESTLEENENTLDDYNKSITQLNQQINELNIQITPIMINYNPNDKSKLIETINSNKKTIDKLRIDISKININPEYQKRHNEFLDVQRDELKEKRDKITQKHKSLQQITTYDIVELEKTQKMLITQFDKCMIEQNRLKDLKTRYENIILEQRNYSEKTYELYQSLLKEKDLILLEQSNMIKLMEPLKLTIDKLKEYKYNPDCEFCVNNVIVKEAYKAKDELGKYSEQLNLLNNKILSLNDQIESNKYIVQDKENHIKLIQRQNDAKNNIISITDQLMKLNITDIQNQLNKIEDQITKYHQNEDNIKLNYSIEKEIEILNKEYNELEQMIDDEYEENMEKVMQKNKMETQLMKLENDILKDENKLKVINDQLKNKELQIAISKLTVNRDKYVKSVNEILIQNKDLNSELTQLNVNKNTIEHHIKQLNEEIKKLKELSDDLDNLTSQEKLYKLYMTAVNTAGIPYYLICEYIPIIENEVNTILSQLVDFTLKFEHTDKNLNIILQHNNGEINLTASSGFETFVSNLVIRMAIQRFSVLSKPNFIGIDEGWGSMDQENLALVPQIFNYVKEYYDFVLIISHIDSIKDEYDDTINILRKDGVSLIKN